MTNDQPPPRDEAMLRVLRDRDGTPSTVVLADGTRLTVVNIAWGYDIGDAFAHVTTNASPFVEGMSLDFFYTSSVVAILDPVSGTVLLETDWRQPDPEGR